MKIEEHYEENYRKEVVEELCSSIKKGYCRSLVSVRGCGQAPLFKFLRFHHVVKKKFLEGENVYFSLINLEEMFSTDQKTVLKELLRDLKNILTATDVKNTDYISAEFSEGVASSDDQEILYHTKNLLKTATESDIKIVSLLEEFGDLASTQLPILNTLFNLHILFKPNFVCVFGVHSLPERLRPGEPTSFDFIFQDAIFMKPFDYKSYILHYKNHFAEDGLNLTEKHLKILYQYTGGLASYNRALGFKITQNDLYKLENWLALYSQDSQMLLRTRQVLQSFSDAEIQTLRQVSAGKKLTSADQKYFQDLGIITQEGKIFSSVFAEHFSNLEKPKSGLVIDSASEKVLVDEVEISFYLSPIEYKFVSYLFERKGQLCDREKIIDYAWGGNPEGVSDEAVDQLVSRLRSKLASQTGRSDLITTVRGRGFILS